jgi:outer membrane protein
MRLILLVLLPFLAHAQQPAAKLAVINGQQALAGTQEGKKTLDRLKSRMDAKAREFEARQTEIGQLEDQVNRGGSVMAAEKREQLVLTINDKKKRLQRDSEDAREEAERDQQQSAQALEEKLNSVIDKYSSEHGYSLVIDYSTPGSGVRYRASGIDITADIVALYDKTHPAGKP